MFCLKHLYASIIKTLKMDYEAVLRRMECLCCLNIKLEPNFMIKDTRSAKQRFVEGVNEKIYSDALLMRRFVPERHISGTTRVQ